MGNHHWSDQKLWDLMHTHLRQLGVFDFNLYFSVYVSAFRWTHFTRKIWLYFFFVCINWSYHQGVSDEKLKWRRWFDIPNLSKVYQNIFKILYTDNFIILTHMCVRVRFHWQTDSTHNNENSCNISFYLFSKSSHRNHHSSYFTPGCDRFLSCSCPTINTSELISYVQETAGI